MYLDLLLLGGDSRCTFTCACNVAVLSAYARLDRFTPRPPSSTPLPSLSPLPFAAEASGDRERRWERKKKRERERMDD